MLQNLNTYINITTDCLLVSLNWRLCEYSKTLFMFSLLLLVPVTKKVFWSTYAAFAPWYRTIRGSLSNKRMGNTLDYIYTVFSSTSFRVYYLDS